MIKKWSFSNKTTRFPYLGCWRIETEEAEDTDIELFNAESFAVDSYIVAGKLGDSSDIWS